MRPLRVVMQAFGPYSGVQVVDFADLRGKDFFLITGPTGAGKTTVLDAMCFALYGVTSGGPESEGGRSGSAMRSDHAEPDVLTSVTFEFALGPDLYRIVREPEQARPKKHGDGVTMHKQDATLWRLDRDESGRPGPEREVVASGWRSVNEASQDLLGFRSEQFRQVVMLPQGQFQKLLAADTSQREAILKALFTTAHYQAIELTLKDRAASLSKENARVATQRDEVLRNAEAGSADGLADRRDRLAIDAQEAAAHAEQAEAARDTAQAGLTAGQSAAAVLRERDDATAAVAAVEARSAEAERARAERDAAAKAAAVADVAAAAAAAAATARARREAKAQAVAGDEAAAKVAAEAAEKLAAAEALAGERERAADEVRRLETLTDVAAALATARDDDVAKRRSLETARSAQAGAEDAWKQAHASATAAEAAWRSGQAGLLAAGLVAGEACPVCGSTDHPAPAELAADVPGAERLDQASAAAEAARPALDASSKTLAQAEAAAAASGTLLAERERAATPECDDAGVLARAIAAAVERSAVLTAGLEAARAADAAAATAAAGAAARRLAAVDESARAGAAEVTAAETFAARLDDAGFADPAAWEAAARDPEEASRLTAVVETFEADRLRSAERLRLATVAAEGVAAPDVPGLQAAATAAAEEARAARTAAVQLQEAAKAAAGALARLEELEAQAGDLHRRYEVLGRLADVANGSNSLHLSFQRYVLAAFLDDVLVAASQRLHLMSHGRYRLERTDKRYGGKQAAGLNLDAFDAWTGVARPVSTLSGGETFMAALALALGLAEVVQAHAGGIRLETVFVDEGFGSLDEESLEGAVRALMDLKDGGRLVGIISHVGELKERIDARLEVEAGKTGSRARFVVA